jgi:hypothetical protein
MNERPYWHKLLDLFERKNYFRNGLTIPFIVGSRQYIEPSKKLQAIGELINEINNSSYYVSILKCDAIGEYVFSLSSLNDHKIYGGVDNIVTIDTFDTTTNSDDIVKELELKYEGIINSKAYSKTNGEWGDYTNEEINLIHEINTTL